MMEAIPRKRRAKPNRHARKRMELESIMKVFSSMPLGDVTDNPLFTIPMEAPATRPRASINPAGRSNT